jgi:N-glycosylase/DNA lyase
MTPFASELAAQYAPTIVTFDVDAERVSFDWGLSHELGSAAFWTDQARRRVQSDERFDFRLGATLAEEVVACLLGGYGIQSAVGLAAFAAVRETVDLSSSVEANTIEQVLREPLVVKGRPSQVRYRFPRQRANRIAAALDFLGSGDPPTEPHALRDWLRGLPGIGPKTASWIVRNFTGSSDVAIIDIHIHRAGVGIGCFLPHWALPRDYEKFERAFLLLAAYGGVPAAVLDAFMWYELQGLGKAAGALYGVTAPGPDDPARSTIAA